jgi:hypothetical protein
MAASPRPYLAKPRPRRRHDLGERAELGDQRLGERLDVAARDGAEQHQLQQLVFGDGVGSAAEEAFPQPLAMAEIMRRAFGGAAVVVALARLVLQNLGYTN